MCRVLGVSRGGYYNFTTGSGVRKSRPQGERQAKQGQSTANGGNTNHFSKKPRHVRYGAPRIHAELNGSGTPFSLNRVACLMRKAGIRARRRRLFKVTTTLSRHSYPVAPNVLNRQFWALGPNEKWVSDITYIPTREGWLYLAAVLDVYSRKVVGWAMDGGGTSTWRRNWLLRLYRWPPLTGTLAGECCTTQTEAASMPPTTINNCWALTRWW